MMQPKRIEEVLKKTSIVAKEKNLNPKYIKNISENIKIITRIIIIIQYINEYFYKNYNAQS